MQRRLSLGLLVLLAFVWPGIAAPASNFTFGAAFGPHPVGFRVVHQYDYTRAYKPAFDAEGRPVAGERARPIQTFIWYPAKPAAGAAPISFGRYFELIATEENFNLDEAGKAAAVKAVLAAGHAEAQYEIERALPMKAYWEAAPENGPYPAVVYAPSFSSSGWENSDLCEYLASHGYIVVASPDMGSHVRAMTSDLAGIQAQAADIGFLVGYLKQIPQADVSRIAAMGFSWGGISNVYAALQDDRISALVCLDGSIRYYPTLFKDLKSAAPSRLTIPLLFLAQSGPILEEIVQNKMDLSSSFLNDAKYADIYFARFNGMSHGNFASSFIRLLPESFFVEYTPKEVSESFSWVARYLRAFLDATLKGDAAGREFLKATPEKNGVPRHLLTPQTRLALHPAPNAADFARELAKRGFDKAAALWQEAKAKDSGFQIPAAELDALGTLLLGEKKVAEALSILKLAAAEYANDFHAHESLGAAYAAAGDKANAIASYKKSLELNPLNPNPAEQLKKLESAPIK